MQPNLRPSRGESELVRLKLEEAKPLIKCFGLDYDGTVSDATHKQADIFGLVEKIVSANKSLAFITARAATAIKVLAPPFQELLSRRDVSVPMFIAGGNGTTLYEVKRDALIEIYNHGFNLAEVRHAVEMGRKVYGKLGISTDDLAEKGLETFRKFLQESWEGYVPAHMIDVCAPYNGELFTEQAKVTFVLPKDKTLHAAVVSELNTTLGAGYRAAAGDDTYVHITRKLEEDSKAVAVKTILNILHLETNHVATFGDMPTGNDAGLLSFPYSFTNSDEFATVKADPEQPPYLLLDPVLSPVDRVYQAVEYLLS
jgi:hydroxymethylpyrimidine pyrophosphatase-like HAD family hydrolase